MGNIIICRLVIQISGIGLKIRRSKPPNSLWKTMIPLVWQSCVTELGGIIGIARLAGLAGFVGLVTHLRLVELVKPIVVPDEMYWHVASGMIVCLDGILWQLVLDTFIFPDQKAKYFR
ncbi:hypothetical protein F4782DRAFT_497283 [Xylaria castorea]|nr:hypothetical protein F4782DRAFT_497283 [Xylaria castorea]